MDDSASKRPLPNVYELLHAITRDKQQARPSRDLAKSALSLLKHYPNENALAGGVAKLVVWAIQSGTDAVTTARDAIEDLIDEEASPDVVFDTIRKVAHTMNLELEALPPKSNVQPNAEMGTVNTIPIAQIPNMRVYNDSQGVEIKIGRGAIERRQWGHEIHVTASRGALPVGDFSVHDRQKNTKYESDGNAEFHFGGKLYF